MRANGLLSRYIDKNRHTEEPDKCVQQPNLLNIVIQVINNIFIGQYNDSVNDTCHPPYIKFLPAPPNRFSLLVRHQLPVILYTLLDKIII